MPFLDAKEVVLAFIDAINRKNVDRMCELMTDNHLFVDSLGSTVSGKEAMRKGWIGYFYMIPDFTISCSEVIQKENLVGLFGVARGTYAVDGKLLDENKWEMPAAWKAVVRDKLVAEWHVYADNEPVRRIMAATVRG
jgi:ketosteroid isomerase-like protein